MQILYTDGRGRDRSKRFRAVLVLRHLLPRRLMATLWYRLLTGPGAPILWARSADYDGDGRLELRGGVAVLKGVRLDVRGGVVKLGSGVVLNAFAILWQDGGGVMELADHVYIGPHCVLDGTGGLTIGEGTMLGPGVKVNSSAHRISAEQNFRDSGFMPRGVVIERDVWIASNAVVVDGVRIGEGAIVGAGAVVTRDVPARHLAVGVPATSRPIHKFSPGETPPRG